MTPSLNYIGITHNYYRTGRHTCWINDGSIHFSHLSFCVLMYEGSFTTFFGTYFQTCVVINIRILTWPCTLLVTDAWRLSNICSFHYCLWLKNTYYEWPETLTVAQPAPYHLLETVVLSKSCREIQFTLLQMSPCPMHEFGVLVLIFYQHRIKFYFLTLLIYEPSFYFCRQLYYICFLTYLLLIWWCCNL